MCEPALNKDLVFYTQLMFHSPSVGGLVSVYRSLKYLTLLFTFIFLVSVCDSVLISLELILLRCSVYIIAVLIMLQCLYYCLFSRECRL